MRLDLSIWFGQALLSKVTWASCHFRKMADAIGFEAVNYGSGFKLTPCSSRQNSILAIHVIQFLHPMSLWSRAELVSIFFVYMSNFYRFFLLHHRMKLFVTQICFKHFQESKGQLNQRLRRWLYVIFFQDVLRCKGETWAELGFYPPKHSTAGWYGSELSKITVASQSLFAPHQTSKKTLHAVILSFSFTKLPAGNSRHSWEISYLRLRDFLKAVCRLEFGWAKRWANEAIFRILLISWLETTKNLLPMFLLQKILCTCSYNWAYK